MCGLSVVAVSGASPLVVVSGASSLALVHKLLVLVASVLADPGSRAQVNSWWLAGSALPTACGMFPQHGSNLHPLHCKAES